MPVASMNHQSDFESFRQKECEDAIAEVEKILSQLFLGEAKTSVQKRKAYECSSSLKSFADKFLKYISLENQKTNLSKHEPVTDCKSLQASLDTTKETGIMFTAEQKKLLKQCRRSSQTGRHDDSLLPTECRSMAATSRDTEGATDIQQRPISSEDINNDPLLNFAEEHAITKLSVVQRSEVSGL